MKISKIYLSAMIASSFCTSFAFGASNSPESEYSASQPGRAIAPGKALDPSVSPSNCPRTITTQEVSTLWSKGTPQKGYVNGQKALFVAVPGYTYNGTSFVEGRVTFYTTLYSDPTPSLVSAISGEYDDGGSCTFDLLDSKQDNIGKLRLRYQPWNPPHPHR